MEAREVIKSMKSFFERLAKISPWEMPFDVSGTTARQSYLPIKEDFSDFDEVLYQAMDNKDVRYFSESDPDDMRIRPDSKSVYGMSATFSDYLRKKNNKKIVTIRFDMGPMCIPSYSSIVINVPLYMPGEINESWSRMDAEIPQAIFDYMIDFSDSDICGLSSYFFDKEIKDSKIDKFPLGWLSYTTNENVARVLTNDPCVCEYKRGILIKLGNSVSVFNDPVAKENAVRIKNILRENNLTDWRE